jgi:hypothetical protein
MNFLGKNSIKAEHFKIKTNTIFIELIIDNLNNVPLTQLLKGVIIYVSFNEKNW